MTNKQLKDLTEDERSELKIEFAPGCFDNFEGTQEELDELITEIKRMFESGEAIEKARLIDLDELTDDDAEIVEHLTLSQGRTLQ